MLPAVLWSSKPLRYLRIAGDHLVWVAEHWYQNTTTDVWTIRLDELGHVAPRLLESFPVLRHEYEWENGETETSESNVHTSAFVVAGEWIYTGHPHGVARIARTGDAPTTLIPIDHQLAFDENRDVQDLAVVGSRVLCLGNVSADGKARSIVLAQVAPGMPTTLWEAPVSEHLSDLKLAVHEDRCWFYVDHRLYSYRDGQVVALNSGAEDLYQLLAAPAGLFACDGHGNLVALDHETGAFRYTLIHGCPGETIPIIQTGAWICMATWNGEHSTILAARADGSESRCIACIEGSVSELCTDGRFLYWTWTDSAGGCLCRTPLERDGAPVPLEVSPPDVVHPRRALPRGTGGKVIPRGLPPPDTADAATRALAHEVIAAALDPTVADPAPARAFSSRGTGGCSWRSFAIALRSSRSSAASAPGPSPFLGPPSGSGRDGTISRKAALRGRRAHSTR